MFWSFLRTLVGSRVGVGAAIAFAVSQQMPESAAKPSSVLLLPPPLEEFFVEQFFHSEDTGRVGAYSCTRTLLL